MEDPSSSKNTKPRNRLSIIGLLLFVVPLKLAALRLYSLHVFTQNAHIPFQAMVRSFDSHFANFEQDPIITTIILIVATASLWISIMGFNAASKTFRLLNALVTGGSSVIIVLQILMIISAKTA